jgi:peptidyl-prolyl cis-trans isomerase B (cyclophilin B)
MKGPSMAKQYRTLLTLMTAGMLFLPLPAFAQQADPVVVLATTKGQIAIRVLSGMVPNTSRNFLDLVNRGYYDGKIFHRVEGWVIQGGCPYGNGQGNFTDPDTGQERFIPLEINRNVGHNRAGMVAMARSQNPNSASCQFYILKRPMPQLNGQYAVFAVVVGGLDTVYRIGVGDRIISATIAGANRPSSDSQASESESHETQSRETRQTTPTKSSAGSSSSGGATQQGSESGF